MLNSFLSVYTHAQYMCVYDSACSSLAASVHNYVHVQNILKYKRSTAASPQDSKG